MNCLCTKVGSNPCDAPLSIEPEPNELPPIDPEPKDPPPREPEPKDPPPIDPEAKDPLPIDPLPKELLPLDEEPKELPPKDPEESKEDAPNDELGNFTAPLLPKLPEELPKVPDTPLP